MLNCSDSEIEKAITAGNTDAINSTHSNLQILIPFTMSNYSLRTVNQMVLFYTENRTTYDTIYVDHAI